MLNPQVKGKFYVELGHLSVNLMSAQQALFPHSWNS